MKKNIFLILTACSVLLNIVLGTYLDLRKPKCEHVHLDEIDRTKDVIPNEKAAEKLAEVFIGSLDEKHRWIKGREHGIEISYDDQSYEWIISYNPNVNAEEEGSFVLDGGKTVWIRRDYGTVFVLWR